MTHRKQAVDERRAFRQADEYIPELHTQRNCYWFPVGCDVSGTRYRAGVYRIFDVLAEADSASCL